MDLPEYVDVEVVELECEYVIRFPIDRQAEARRQAIEEFWSDICWKTPE